MIKLTEVPAMIAEKLLAGMAGIVVFGGRPPNIPAIGFSERYLIPAKHTARGIGGNRRFWRPAAKHSRQNDCMIPAIFPAKSPPKGGALAGNRERRLPDVC